jgi:hypothetical protein
MNVLMEPLHPMDGLRVAFFQTEDGAVVEFMEYEESPFDT